MAQSTQPIHNTVPIVIQTQPLAIFRNNLLKKSGLYMFNVEHGKVKQISIHIYIGVDRNSLSNP